VKAGGKIADLPREEALRSFLLLEAFLEFGQIAAEFSGKIVLLGRRLPEENEPASFQDALREARSVFGKWNMEILTLLHSERALGFQEIRRSLGPVSTAVLSKKLNWLEQREIIRRSVITTRPPRVRYALTEGGLTLFKLAEPLFLYLRLRDLIPSQESVSEKPKHPAINHLFGG